MTGKLSERWNEEERRRRWLNIKRSEGFVEGLIKRNKSPPNEI